MISAKHEVWAATWTARRHPRLVSTPTAAMLEG